MRDFFAIDYRKLGLSGNVRVNYFTGGMMMPGRNTEHDWSRMGAQNSPKDDEVYGKGNLIDMGDRQMDTRILRAFKPDIKASKYPHLSPYSYANNNPILFVDKDGEENVIYLVVLPTGRAAFSKQNLTAQAIANQANKNFKALGLNTRVVVFNGGANNFDITKIDPHDAVAVFGGKEEVTGYVKNQLKDAEFSNELQKGFGGDNPEKSEDRDVGVTESDGGYPLSTDNIIAVDAEALTSASYSMQIWDEADPVTKTAAALINHGAGHNARHGHTSSGMSSILMTSASTGGKNTSGITLSQYFTAPGNNESVMTNKSGQNASYNAHMKLRFGDQKAQTNYPTLKHQTID